jgi:predicted TIM-barrel fold metal-dependent hydrolase
MSMNALPPNACDCHVHLIGPPDHYPFAADRVYTPGEATEVELRALHRRLGIGHVVIVQPSVYGTDNRRTLEGLRRLGPASRAVAVISAATTETELDSMHEAGVRGVRVNIATAGQHDPELAWHAIDAQAQRIAHRGWHVQVLTRLDVIAALAPRIADLPIPLVFDHFGLAKPEAGTEQPGFAELVELVHAGHVVVKLSAIERLTGAGRGEMMIPFIRQLAEANPQGVIWGSDWPHTGGGRGAGRPVTAIEPFQLLDDGRAIRVVVDALGDHALLHRVFVANPARLYDFPEDHNP